MVRRNVQAIGRPQEARGIYVDVVVVVLLLLYVVPANATPESVVSFKATPSMFVDVGLDTPGLDAQEISRVFYETHDDTYNTLVIWTDFPVALAGGAARSLYVPVRNNVTGINAGLSGRRDEVFNSAEMYGSSGHLSGVVFMGNISDAVDDPNDPGFNGGFSVLNVLGHETMHRFGAFATYRDADGLHDDTLGRGGTHWSFFFHSGGSDLEGNTWEALGDGRFLSHGGGGRFSHLDQYLMGLRLPEQVEEEFFVLRNPQPALSPASPPLAGTVVSAQVAPVTVSMLEDALGKRVPSAADTDKTFLQAHILLTLLHSPQADEVTKVDRFRRAWNTYFFEGTDYMGRVLTRADGRDDSQEWRFVNSMEGWTLDGVAGEASGGLTVQVQEGPLHITHNNLHMAAEDAARILIELSVADMEGECEYEGVVRLIGDTTSVDLPFTGTPDGAVHTYTLAPDVRQSFVVRAMSVEVGLAHTEVHLRRIAQIGSLGRADADSDGVLDTWDNCPTTSNAHQADWDQNGIGDTCEGGVTMCNMAKNKLPADVCTCTSIAKPPNTYLALPFFLVVLLSGVRGRSRRTQQRR